MTFLKFVIHAEEAETMQSPGYEQLYTLLQAAICCI